MESGRPVALNITVFRLSKKIYYQNVIAFPRIKIWRYQEVERGTAFRIQLFHFSNKNINWCPHFGVYFLAAKWNFFQIWENGFHYSLKTLNTNHYFGDILSTWNTISPLCQFRPNGLNNISVDSLVWLVDVIASILLKFSKSPCGSSWMNWNLEIGDYKKFSTIVIL